jgi:hypothetical protein
VEYTIEFGGMPQDVTITTTGLADAEHDDPVAGVLLAG